MTMFPLQVRRDNDPLEGSEHILALNMHGVHFLDLITHETILHYPFTEVISTRQMETEDGVLYLDMKCGNLMQQRISRIQTDQAVEIARLIKQYITIGTQSHHYFFWIWVCTKFNTHLLIFSLLFQIFYFKMPRSCFNFNCKIMSWDIKTH